MEHPKVAPGFGAEPMVDGIAINLDRQDQGRKEIINKEWFLEPIKFEMVINYPSPKVMEEVNIGEIDTIYLVFKYCERYSSEIVSDIEEGRRLSSETFQHSCWMQYRSDLQKKPWSTSQL